MRELIDFQKRILNCQTTKIIEINLSIKLLRLTYVLEYIDNDVRKFVKVKLNQISYIKLEENGFGNIKLGERMKYPLIYLKNSDGSYIVYLSLRTERYYVKCKNIEIIQLMETSGAIDEWC